VSNATVVLWGSRIGAVSLAPDATTADFEYDPDFLRSRIEVAPIEMPLAPDRQYRFPGLSAKSFKGLPGLLADSLPDRFGSALIDAWLASQGREPDSFDAVERLCYVGQRGMGALEFRPARGPKQTTSHPLDVEALAELAAEVVANRNAFSVSLSANREAMREILRVGTSAGGARAKALIALNPETEEVRSGQIPNGSGFEYWILKFDGVEDKSRDLGNSRGYGAIEWAYSRMAGAAGIEMSECKLLEEGGRRHFMTKRFDRTATGEKLHMQSLSALLHLDFDLIGAHSYDQAFHAIRRLGLGHEAAVEQFRRMTFNVVARNQDDHVKNIAFLMDRTGTWSLSPAFDVVYAHSRRQDGNTAHHQMSINGKVDGITREDLVTVGATANLKRTQAIEIVDQVSEAVGEWPRLADEAGVEPVQIARIGADHRLALPRS
jgi:serine/threonine-protein kinase HipA